MSASDLLIDNMEMQDPVDSKNIKENPQVDKTNDEEHVEHHLKFGGKNNQLQRGTDNDQSGPSNANVEATDPPPPEEQSDEPYSFNVANTDPPPPEEHSDEQDSFNDMPTCQRGVWWLSVVLLSLLVTLSTGALSIYLFCYFAKRDHFLRFLAHMCYWLSLMSAQIICLVGMLKNKFRKERPETSWTNMFEKSVCKNGGKNVRALTIIFMSIVCIVHIALKVAFTAASPREGCRTLIQWSWVALESVAALFFLIMCCFIYLKRIALEEDRVELSSEIKEPLENIDDSITKIRKFFRKYYQLRELTLTWFCILLFNSMFSFAVVLAWNYNVTQTEAVPTVPTTVAVHGIEILRNTYCTYRCDTAEFMHESAMRPLYNTWVLWRHLMTAILPCLAAHGIDIRFIWKDFRDDLNDKYTDNNRERWERLFTFVDRLHPKTSADSMLTFLITFLGLVAGLLSGTTSNF